MELILFYITAPLCVLLLGILLTRHEKLGALVSQIEALKTDNAELRQKLKDELKKEAENSNHLLRRLGEQYNEAVEREQNKVKEAHVLHNEFKLKLLEALKESDKRVAASEERRVVPVMDLDD